MPTYNYRCTDCGHQIELLQTFKEMEQRQHQYRCGRCEGKLVRGFPAPNLHTNTTFLAGLGDGFGDHESMKRDHATRAARQAGVNPTGKTYCPGLCAPGTPNDPAAWVPHADPKGYIKRRCEELNYGCEGMVNVPQRESGGDSLDEPYRVADDLVSNEVDDIVEAEHGGQVTPAKRADLVEATQEKRKGNA